MKPAKSSKVYNITLMNEKGYLIDDYSERKAFQVVAAAVGTAAVIKPLTTLDLALGQALITPKILDTMGKQPMSDHRSPYPSRRTSMRLP